MPSYTVALKSGIMFNVKAQTINQALVKVDNFLAREDIRAASVTPESINIYVVSHKVVTFDKSLPFLSMTTNRMGFYRANPNTNKKVLALFGIKVPTSKDATQKECKN